MGYGSVLAIDKDIDTHRSFEIKLFTNPRHVHDNNNDWPIRLLLSSFWIPTTEPYGIPDGLSNCDLATVQANTCDPQLSMNKTIGYVPGSPGYTGNEQAGQYTRTHRDNAIINAMRSWMQLPPINTRDFGNI